MATVYIGSVSPIPLKITRPLYGGIYEIPAVKRGEKPFVLKVEDKIQYERQPITHAEVPMQVPGEQIATCLLAEVNQGAPGMGTDSDMGLWIIGPTPDYTEEQVEAANFRLGNFLRFQMHDTDSWTAERRAKFNPLPKLRLIAVEWLGEKRDWATKRPHEVTVCPFCQNSVKAGAIKCEHCNEIIDQDGWNRLRPQVVEVPKIPIPTAQAKSQPTAR